MNLFYEFNIIIKLLCYKEMKLIWKDQINLIIFIGPLVNKRYMNKEIDCFFLYFSETDFYEKRELFNQ
jgi:hypothetical protein